MREVASASVTVVKAAWARLISTPAGRAAAALVAVSCLTLTAMQPAMFGSLQASDDGALHFVRLVVLDYSVRHGDVWPRFEPVLTYGYGSPIFNYYSPLYLYPMEALHLAGLSVTSAFLLAIIAYVALGALGAFLLGDAWGGPVVGLLASAAYTYAPYMLMNWPRRGAVPEFLGVALLVWAMWAFWRVSRRGRRRDLFLAVLFFTLLICNHNIMAMIGAALLAVYSLLLWWTSPDPRRAFIRLALALVLPLGLGAIFWVPALYESGLVKVGNAAVARLVHDMIHSNFMPLTNILSPPLTVDLNQLNSPEHPSLGWPELLLTMLGAGLIFWRSYHHRGDRSPLFYWAALSIPLVIVFVFLITPASAPLWDAITLTQFVQYPWRLLGPISLLLAVLAGAGAVLAAGYLRWPALRAAWLGTCLLAIILYGVPWLYGPYLAAPPASNVVDVQNFERQTGFIGSTSFGEFTPVWVTILPDQNRLAGLYARYDVIPRLQPAPGVQVIDAQWETRHASLTIKAAQPTTLTFDWLYFPGWWAHLDGEKTPITPNNPTGLISVEVPAGEHTLELGFGLTPLRRAATYISLGGLVLLAAVLIALRVWRKNGGLTDPASFGLIGWGQAGPYFAAAALVGLLAFGLKALVIDNINSPFKRDRFADGVLAGLQHPAQINYDNKFTLLGYDLPQEQVRSGGKITVTLYWTVAGGMLDAEYSTNLVLRDGEGNVVAQILPYYPGSLSTTHWIPGFYVRDPLTLNVPPGTPPGTYTLQAGMYSQAAGRNLDVLNAAGNPTGVLADLATITITRPLGPARPSALGVDPPLNDRLTPVLTLLGVSTPPIQAEVGQPLPVIWYWRAASAPGEDVSARLLWLDAAGEVAGETPPMALASGYPTSGWRHGDVWRGLHMVYVPGQLEAGDYEVAVQVYTPGGEPVGERGVIGQMHVDTPPRAYAPPDDMTPVAAIDWQNAIRLLGYRLSADTLHPGDGLGLSLYWQPGSELTSNLTVFVHLIDGSQHIVAQRDQIPASGERPTTGWATGEVITDSYGLVVGADVPPGDYQLQIGWYDAISGERVPLVGGAHVWLLPQIITIRAR